MITAELLRSRIHYDPLNGCFTWITNQRSSLVGKEAGRLHKQRGYREIYINGRLHYAHRLAWLYMTGELPIGEIDHRNHDKGDNAWSNLRDVTVSINQQNRKTAQSNNLSGLLGVSRYKKGDWIRWTAKICSNGKQRTIGYFNTPEEAHSAYLTEKRKLHVGCTI